MLRSMGEGDREALRTGVRRVAEQVALAHGCTARVTITPGEPVLVNDERLAAATEAWLTRAGTPIADPPRSCGSDDFSFYRQVAPTLMMFVGPPGGPPAGLHSARFLPPDDAVGAVAGAMLAGYLGAVDAAG
jgi:amidohydrolase